MINVDKVMIESKGVFPCKKKPIIVHAIEMDAPFEVTTMESGLSGKLEGKAGDYLMFGIKGEKYPCDKEIFEESYDRVKSG